MEPLLEVFLSSSLQVCHMGQQNPTHDSPHPGVVATSIDHLRSLSNCSSRGSSKISPAHPDAESFSEKSDTTRSIPRVPTELLDRIVTILLASSSQNKNRSAFTPIASFTLVSVQFRQVGLRQFFHTVQLYSKTQWDGLWSILEAQGETKKGQHGDIGFNWVR